MDFLDHIEIDTISRRSRQVRSWYLYEQYKALERNQREAAQQLNDRTSQDRLLHRELSEHRQRRQMCSERHSEPSVKYIRHGDSSSCINCSIDDLFESFCDLHDDDFCSKAEDDISIHQSCLWSQDDNELISTSETFKTLEEPSEQNELLGDATLSVPQLVLEDPAFLLAASSGNLADDIKEELKYVKRTIEENIHLQLGMKENEKSMEGYAGLQDPKYDEKVVKFEDKTSSLKLGDETPKYVDDSDDEDSLCSLRHRSVSDKSEAYYNNMHLLWAKLVSFAYQVVQLNHGNCYYDYSSQFMTAVLACDVLRRGISRMCNVLQPYVSPIKFVSNSVCTPISSVHTAIKKERNIITLSQIAKKSKTSLGIKYQRKHIRNHGLNETYLKSPNVQDEQTCRSKNVWRQCSANNSRIKMPHSGAWQSLSTRSITLPSDKYSSTICHEESDSKGSEFNSCSTRVTNPMLNLATYIDKILQDTGNINL